MSVAKRFKYMYCLAFFGCKSLKTIDLRDSCIKGIHSEAFCASGLENIQLPQGLTHIYSRAFQNTKVDIDFDSIPNLETIDSHAFENSNITSVDFSKNVSKTLIIEEKVFKDCAQLESVYLSKNTVLKYSSNFENCKKLKTLKIDIATDCVPVSTFKDCINLLSVDMSGSKISHIALSAFKNCNALMAISFPESTKFLAKSAFENCDLSDNVDLTKVKNDVVINKDCFKNTHVDINSIKLDFFNPITIKGNPFTNSYLPLDVLKLKYPFIIMEE